MFVSLCDQARLSVVFFGEERAGDRFLGEGLLSVKAPSRLEIAVESETIRRRVTELALSIERVASPV